MKMSQAHEGAGVSWSGVFMNVSLFLVIICLIDMLRKYSTRLKMTVIIPRETEGYRFGLIRLSVRLSHFEGWCFVDITSPSMEVPRYFFSFI